MQWQSCVTVSVSNTVVDNNIHCNPNSKSNPRSLKANIDGLPLSYTYILWRFGFGLRDPDSSLTYHSWVQYTFCFLDWCLSSLCVCKFQKPKQEISFFSLSLSFSHLFHFQIGKKFNKTTHKNGLEKLFPYASSDENCIQMFSSASTIFVYVLGLESSLK